jgi:hypothetical protein
MTEHASFLSMHVEVLEATDDPEELICQAARNDYASQFVGDTEFEELMETVDGDDLDIGAAGFRDGAEHKPSDTTETVNGDTSCHECFSLPTDP